MNFIKQGNNIVAAGLGPILVKEFPDCSEFYTYAEILDMVGPTDKLGLVIRHSQKQSDGTLSQNGIEWCQEIGDIIADKYSTGETSYYSTDIYRTKQTADEISKRIGDNVGVNNVDISLDSILTSYYFVTGTGQKPSIDFNILSSYSYCDSAALKDILAPEGAVVTYTIQDVFGCGDTDGALIEDINYKASTITTRLIQAITNDLNIFVTHDNMLWPYVVTICGQQISLKWYLGDTQQICYLSGVAIIKHEDGTAELYPIGTSYSDDGTYTEVTNENHTIFNSWSDIKNIAIDDKIALIIRHAERGSDTSQTGELSENGRTQAINLGTQMQQSNIATNDAFYSSTDYYRTKHTAALIAGYRGDTNYAGETQPYSQIDTTYSDTTINGDAYTIDLPSSGTWELMGKYCSNPEALTTAELENYFGITPDDADWETNEKTTKVRAQIISKSRNFIKTIINACANTRLNVFVSHDHYLGPMITYASMIDTAPSLTPYNMSSNHWVNYLAGVAIIIHTNGTYEIVPFKGLDSGYYN